MKVINKSLLENLAQQAKESPRKRMNLNYHQTYEDPINRMLNALQPETYVRPHKHENPDKTEIFIILFGKMVMITFDDEGEITDSVVLSHETGNYIVEIPPKIWHTVVALDETVYYEIKNGPYNVENDKQFANWAPCEKSELSSEYLKNLKSKFKNSYLSH